ncbi:hypothetical protein BaRGS_00007858 [Batillaria attramentaria]|uniref:Uncharacterized protein n=1 Tax=Batillaria attramentaria TaxID=370345 RepID=A0ABD0LNC0_9CAEN
MSQPSGQDTDVQRRLVTCKRLLEQMFLTPSALPHHPGLQSHRGPGVAGWVPSPLHDSPLQCVLRCDVTLLLPPSALSSADLLLTRDDGPTKLHTFATWQSSTLWVRSADAKPACSPLQQRIPFPCARKLLAVVTTDGRRARWPGNGLDQPSEQVCITNWTPPRSIAPTVQFNLGCGGEAKVGASRRGGRQQRTGDRFWCQRKLSDSFTVALRVGITLQ